MESSKVRGEKSRGSLAEALLPIALRRRGRSLLKVGERGSFPSSEKLPKGHDASPTATTPGPERAGPFASELSPPSGAPARLWGGVSSLGLAGGA